MKSAMKVFALLMSNAFLIGVVAGCATSATSTASSGASPVSATSLPTCPSSWAGASRELIVWGDSSSQRDSAIVSSRVSAVLADLRVAAACRIPAKVIFVPAQTHTTVLWSGPVRKDAATSILTSRLSTRLITTQAMPQIQAGLQQVLAVKPQPIDDPAGLFAVIADESRTGGKIVVSILDDFIESDNTTNLNKPGLTPDQARQLAGAAGVPRLGQAVVAIDGVAATTEVTAPPNDWAAAIRVFADTMCAASGATCIPATTQIVGWTTS